MRGRGLDTWVYSGNDWLITNASAPHVAREAWTVKFQPKVVSDIREHLQQVAKIVGISDDLDKVRRCEADAQAAFGQRATANRSQPYYLDVTNKDANKGAVVEYLASHLGVPAEEIATIGDQPNDVLMFKRSGSASPWETPRMRSRRKPRPSRFPTMMKVLPRRWSPSSSVQGGNSS